jgi:autotransporter-associated beta strand protein
MQQIIKNIYHYSSYIKGFVFVCAFGLASIWFFANSHDASAATRTWTGTNNDLWSVAANWGGAVPVTGDDLVFPVGASNLTTTNDLTENTIFNSITISGSGYTLTGNRVILGAGLAGLTDSASSGGNTIALDIRLDATRDITVTNSAESLTFSGRLEGVGGINKEGLGELILSGNNTYGGTTKINVGIIHVSNSTGLGTFAAGTEVVGGAVLELDGNISIGYEALALRGYGDSETGALRNVSGDNTFAGLITLSSAGGTEIASDSGTLTLTGGITGAVPLFFDGAGNITFTTAPIAISTGTVTKNGAGTVTYNFPNTYTGLTTVNAGTLLYGVDNALLSGPVTVTGGTLDIATFSDMIGAVTLGTLDLASGTITGSTGMLSASSWTVYNGTISAVIAGDAATLTKSTPGTVTLTRANQYTGATTVSVGVLKIQDSSSLGTIDGITTVSAGATLQIDGDGLSVAEYITFSGHGHLYSGAIWNSNGDNTINGLLTLGANAMMKADASTTLTVDTKGLSAAALALTVAGAGNITFTSTAPIYGSTATLTKNDTGVLNIQSYSNITGATTINRGTLLLDSAGAIPGSTVTVNSGATLTLDNNGTSIINRISDSAALTLNGASFNFIGNGSSISSETAGALTLSSGHNIVTVTPGAGGSTIMTFASLSRTAGATVLFRGTNLGSNPGVDTSTILFTSAPTLTGASGAANTTTISIIKGAFGDGSLVGNGTDMVTYNVGNTNGIRLLNGVGFVGEYAADLSTANANVKLIANTAATTVSINSFIANGYSITNPGSSETITMASASLSGNIIMNSATSIAGSNTTIGITTFELDVLTTANASISAVIGTAVAGSLTVSGTGNITLSGSNAYTGLTAINNATVTCGASNVVSSGNVTVVGGTLDIGSNSDSVGAVTLQNGIITGTSGVLTGSSYSFREGTVSAIIGGGSVVTVIATNAAADTVVTMTRNNTYTGATTITSGILRLGAAGDATNTPLGTSAGGVSVATIGSLDLNGFTLGTAEPITSLSGLGFGPSATLANGNSNMGAIMNTSNDAVSYSGTVALGAAARISADYGALTFSGNFSGAFALTIAGFSNTTISGVIGTGTGTVVKDGIGVLTLSNSNTYTGVTTISMGTLKLGATGGATNTPLGTTGGATSVTSGARLDLNGYSLGTAEPLTLNGTGYGIGNGASGALINGSGSSVTYSGLITLGSATTIKADSGSINLSNAGTISGATFGLTLGGSGNGTLVSILGTTTGTLTKIGTGSWTLSGQSTYTGATSINLGTLKLGANGGATNSPLGTTGGTTSVMTGAALDFNGFTMSTAEGLTVNGRGIGNGGVLIGSSGTYSGTIALATDSRITNASGTMTMSAAVSGAFALYISGSGNITFGVAIPTTGFSVVKQGSGTFTVTGTNLYTSETRVDDGTFAYAATTTLAGTSLVMKGGVFNNGANADTIGAVTLIGGTITNSAALTGTAYTFESGTVSGILAGAVAVTKNTNNTVSLTAADTISSTITINAGTLALSGSGSVVSVTGFTVNLGGVLALDNSGTNVASRIGDAIVVTMNGGEFSFTGKDSTTVTETIGQFAFASGHNIVTIDPKAGSGGSGTTLTVANNPGFNRSAGATVLFRGTSLGATPAAGVANLKFTTTPTLTGAAGAASSTTISVIKGAFGDNSISGTGTDMVTYNVGNTNGVRLLNGAGFSGEYAGDLQTANANVKLTADRAAVATNTNSLILNNFSITNPGGAITIPISSASLAGNILMNSATNIAGANTTLGITTTELDILATANESISANIGTATTGSLVLSGSGNVTLSAANPYTSTTFINNATLTYGASNVLSSGGVTIVGGTYNLNGNSDTVGALSINAGTVATGAGTLTGNGTFSTVANNNVASIITGNLGLGANATFTINDGLMDNDAVISAVISGAFTFGKAGNGVLELSGSNTYSGITTISAGTLRLGATGGATNTPLGTTAGSTNVSTSSAALDLNGYTLGTAEALTLTGSLAAGAVQNTSSTAATYSGLITLAAASTIISNYGGINISNGGNITGNTFALTIGGAGNGTLASNLNTTTGTLTKNGVGTWIISGAGSTFTGATTVSAGTLKLGSAGSGSNTPLGTSAGGVSVTSGAIFDLNGYTLATTETLTINGTGIASKGALTTNSAGSTSYTGAIVLGAASRITNFGNGTFTITGAISGNFALTAVAVGGITQSSASVWSGTGTLVKEGSGTLILSGQNSMSGAMTVSTGMLQLGASGGATNTPLGTSAGGVTVAAGAVLNLSTFTLGGASTYETLNLSGSGIKNGGVLIGNGSGTNNFGAMTVAANSRIINSGSGAIVFGGTITAANNINTGIGGTGPITFGGAYGATATSATITKWDSGTLQINVASITTGLVRVNGGTLKYGVVDSLATPALTVAGGTVDLNGFSETNIGVVTLIDGSIINTGGAATFTSTGSYVLEKGTISAVIGGAVATFGAKNTSGKVILSGNNTFTSTSITFNAGILNLQNSNALGAAGTALTTTVPAGATVELENSITIPSTKVITANGTGIANGGAIRNISGTNVISANLPLGTTNVRINSDSGTLTIPTISGNTFNTIFGGAGDIAVTGIISTTSGGVTKDGSGVTTLSGSNSYTGPTTINLGTIVANSTTSIGNGSSTNTLVFKGGTLQATGTITSPGTRTVSLIGNGTFDTNSNDISIAGTVAGGGGLTKSGLGTLTLGAATTVGGDLNISNGTLIAPSSLTLNGSFTNDGTFTHNSGTVIMDPNTLNKIVNIAGSSDTVFNNFTAATPASTIRFNDGNTYTIDGTLTVTGAAGSPVKLLSTSPGSQWSLVVSTVSLTWVAVQDSNCSGLSNITLDNSTILNLGNNSGACWSFITTYFGGDGASEGGPGVGGNSGGNGGSGNGGSGSGGNVQATATATIQSGSVDAVILGTGGSGYLEIPLVCFSGGSPSVDGVVVAIISGGSITGFNLISGGNGYQVAPIVVIGAPGTSGGTCAVSDGGGGAGGGGGASP